MGIKRERELTDLLAEMGCPASLGGYRYLKEAISYVIDKQEKGDYEFRITKELYPEVARIFGKTASQVERACRHAIEVMFDRGDYDELSKVFKKSYSPNRGKPTNTEFIMRVAEYYRHTYLKSEEKELATV